MSQKSISIKPLPIIEYDSSGRHRIVMQGVAREAIASEWVPVTEAVRLLNIYAAPTISPFEEALFTIRAVPHQVLA